MAPGCFARLAGRLLDVTDGWLTNPNTETSEPLHFLYLSKDEKMIAIERSDALHAIQQNLLAYKKRMTAEQITKSKSRLEHCHRKLIKSRIRRRAQYRFEQMHTMESYNCNGASSSNLFSDYDLDDVIANRNTLGNRVSLDEELKSETRTTNMLQNFLLNFDKHKRPVGAKNVNSSERTAECKLKMDINTVTLNIIQRWISKNTTFIKFKGQTDVPSDLFATNREYFIKVLFALNPVVQIEKCVQMTYSDHPIYDAVDIQSQVSQNDFIHALGLVHISSNNNTKIDKSDSIRSNSERHKRKTPEKKKEKMPLTANSKWIKISSTSGKWRAGKTEKRKSHAQSKGAYSPEEDRAIINWVLKGSNSAKVNGNAIWKLMEQKKDMPTEGRTWQSLRSRYVKTILFKLRDYGLSYEEEMQLKVGSERGSQKRAFGKIPNYRINADKENSENLEELRKSKNDPYHAENIAKDDQTGGSESRRKSSRGATLKMRKLFTEKEYIASASTDSFMN